MLLGGVNQVALGAQIVEPPCTLDLSRRTPTLAVNDEKNINGKKKIDDTDRNR
jgi:hypothetical protein